MSRRARAFLAVIMVFAVSVGAASPAAARANWKIRIDRLIGGRSMSVAVRDAGEVLYRHKPSARRAPASGEKLLMSMALLDRLPPETRIETIASTTESLPTGVLRGNLWLLGRGDPSITGGGSFGRSLPFEPTRLSALAAEVERAGITKIRGSVVGAVSYFSHDWWAQGWSSNFPADEIALPSALTFEGNKRKGRHIDDPELRAARSLTRRLEARGIPVRRAPRLGSPPEGLAPVAKVASVPLAQMLRYTNRHSSNFFAEVLGKRLAVEAYGTPGTIANGARAIEAFASRRGVDVDAYDSSGLSYSNRISPNGFTRLLDGVETELWFASLRSTLAGADQGTLEDRLVGVKVRAKTGTLNYISTLSGWVWLRRTDSWAAFSIMSSGMYKPTAAQIEDEIVRELTRNAR
ncbi:MAG: D-alanyl-D-alanine carboxypeptidase/D-alanyl-D-alanine-endopeptidase [Actinomycetota bacterium]